MNAAVWPPSQSPAAPAPALEARFEAFAPHWVDEWVRVEMLAYSFPWTRGNLLDSHASGHQMQALVADHQVLGYFVAMLGVDEVHLLNITVAPEHQGQGWGRTLLDALRIWSRGQGRQWLWLEVRQSNARAIGLYERYGFARVGVRKNYYPARLGREDAVVMSLAL